jgi:hypothetical protein
VPTKDEETLIAIRALVGAALVHPPFARFVGIALDAGVISNQGALTTIALAVAVNHLRGTAGGLDGAAARLDMWGELDRIGGREVLAVLMEPRPELAAKLAELKTLEKLPPITAEPIVQAAARILNAEPAIDDSPSSDPDPEPDMEEEST